MNDQRSYHFKPNPNLPTHYTPTLRNHEIFSYGGGVQQGPRPRQTSLCSAQVPRTAPTLMERSLKDKGFIVERGFKNFISHFTEMLENRG